MPSQERYRQNPQKFIEADRAYRQRKKERAAKRREANRRYYQKHKPALLIVAERAYLARTGRAAKARVAEARSIWAAEQGL